MWFTMHMAFIMGIIIITPLRARQLWMPPNMKSELLAATMTKILSRNEVKDDDYALKNMSTPIGCDLFMELSNLRIKKDDSGKNSFNMEKNDILFDNKDILDSIRIVGFWDLQSSTMRASRYFNDVGQFKMTLQELMTSQTPCFCKAEGAMPSVNPWNNEGCFVNQVSENNTKDGYNKHLNPSNILYQIDAPEVSTAVSNETLPLPPQPSDPSLNAIVDFLLQIVSHEILLTGHDQILLPKIDQSFHKRIGPIHMSGEFTAENGWLKSLSSVYRTEDTVATRVAPNTLSVKVGIGLRTIRFGYNNYYAHLSRIHTHGAVNGKVGYNSIEAQVTIQQVNSTCVAKLNYVKVMELADLSLDITGLRDLHWLQKYVANWIVHSFKTDVVTQIERALEAIAAKKMHNFHC